MVAVIVLGLTTVTLVNLTPLGPVTEAPVTNPVPLRVTGVEVPLATEFGLMFVSVGAAMTLKQVVHVAVLWSGSMTLTL